MNDRDVVVVDDSRAAWSSMRGYLYWAGLSVLHRFALEQDEYLIHRPKETRATVGPRRAVTVDRLDESRTYVLFWHYPSVSAAGQFGVASWHSESAVLGAP